MLSKKLMCPSAGSTCSVLWNHSISCGWWKPVVCHILIRDTERRAEHLFLVFLSYAVAWRDTFCGWSHSFFRKEKEAEENAQFLSFPSSNIEKIPCPIFITSEILLLAARCAETPDDSIYSLRVFNRLREIWAESMKAAQPHTSAGNAQKAHCCLEFLLQSGGSRSCTGTESSTTELEE